MPFDTSIISPWHLVALLGVFIGVYAVISTIIRKRPISWRVHSTGKPIYYAGWIAALCMTAAASFVLEDMNLIWGLLGAVCMIVLIGRLDEEKNISPYRQLFWQSCVAAWAVYFGWTIPHISDPINGGVMVIGFGGIAAFIWFLLCMNAINFLDGTDGLATLVGIIACAALAGISLLPATQDTVTLTLAFIGIGGLSAFFLWNAPPARVYLGTSGSWFLGLFLAMAAIIGGGKIATAIIVLAIPVLDALFVIFSRMIRKKMPWKGDVKSHIHHRLQAFGLSSWGILLVLGAMTCALAFIAVLASTYAKIIVLAAFAVLFFSSRALTMKRV